MSPTEKPSVGLSSVPCVLVENFPGCPVDCRRLFTEPVLVRIAAGTTREAAPKHSSGSCDGDAQL